MPIEHGVFGNASNFDNRFIPDYDRLAKLVTSLRDFGATIVLTSGSFDLVHIGHALYMEKARSFGDVLVVGVDSDIKVRQRNKGPNRPIVPEQERLQMLSHLRSVDLLTLKEGGPDQPKWELIKVVRPDVLVATEGTYKPEQIEQLEAEYCGRVEVLPRMAEGSTSARVRNLSLDLAQNLVPPLLEAMLTNFSEQGATIAQNAVDRYVKTTGPTDTTSEGEHHAD